MHYSETTYGFTYGPATVERTCSDSKKGWVVMLLKTQKHPKGLQIYITKTGNVRIHKGLIEWKPSYSRNVRH